MADLEEEQNGSPDLSKFYAELEGKTVQEILEEGKKALFIELVVKCRAGTASHQELAILRNVLKDNGMVMAGIPSETVKAAERQAAPLDLPDFGEPDYLQ